MASIARMKCPICPDEDLDERYSHGVEVDVCPKCHGAWLNGDDLEKLAGGSSSQEGTLLAASSLGSVQDGSQSKAATKDGDRDDDHEDDDQRDDDDDDRDRPMSWAVIADVLEDIFEEIFDEIEDLID